LCFFFADFIFSCDDTINWETIDWYIDLDDEGPLVTGLFWDVWNCLPVDFIYTWREVLDCVKMKVEGKEMGLLDDRLLVYMEGTR
jgi:hypothetical protein